MYFEGFNRRFLDAPRRIYPSVSLCTSEGLIIGFLMYFEGFNRRFLDAPRRI